MFSDLIEGASARGHRRPCAYLLTLGLAFVCVNGYAQQALSLDRALQLAQGRSRQLIARDAAATASREMAHAAGQLPDPTLKLGVNNLPISGEDRFRLARDFMTMRSVGVMQEITRGDKLKARSARFNREAEAAEASRAVALANLRRDTAMAWLDRYYQERMLEVLRTQRAEAGLQIEAADAAYRGGRGTQADVFAARSMVAQIDDRIRQTEKQIGTAKIKLARWVGEDASQALDTPPSLDAVPLNLLGLEDQLAHHPADCRDGQAGRGGARRCGCCAKQQAR
jgi:outer membrane protein TolC